MARARQLKPDFFLDEDLVELGFGTRLLFAGLWTLADREGRLEDRPRRIEMALFPADTIDIIPMLDELAGPGLIVRYEVEGRALIWIPGFPKHQRPHPREAPSGLPPYQGGPKAQPLHGKPGNYTAGNVSDEPPSDAPLSNLPDPKVNPGENLYTADREKDMLSPSDPQAFGSSGPSDTQGPSGPAVADTPGPALAAAATEDFKKCIQAWEEQAGTISRANADIIDTLLRDVPVEWVLDAITEMGVNGAKSGKYLKAIVDRWQRDGRGSDTRPETVEHASHGDLDARKKRFEVAT